MFKRETVLIVGAGCSAEFGLPVGYGLKDSIANELSRVGQVDRSSGFIVVNSRAADEHLRWAIERSGQAVGDRNWPIIANGLADGIRHAPSIDNYLHLHRDDPAAVAIGKLAIAREIIRAEAYSLLDEDGVDLSEIKAKLNHSNRSPYLWLEELVCHSMMDVPRHDMGQIFSNLTIITFNYDRVIEHYLFHALQSVARLTPEAAAEAMTKLTIIHPYGKIGSLPWQREGGNYPEVPFGSNSHGVSHHVLKAAQNLRTFTEAVTDETVLDTMHQAIANALQIVFLGFSFMPENLRLLTPGDPTKVETIFATRLGESDANVQIATDNIRLMLKPNSWHHQMIRWQSMASGQFMHDFGRLLTG